MPEEKMRGDAINGYIKFVKSKWGGDALDDCLEASGISGDLIQGDYYPKEFRLGILKWIAEEKGEEYLVEAGKYTVLHLGMLSYLIRFATPKVVVNRLKAMYEEIYTYGKVMIDTSDEKHLVVRFYNLLNTKEEHLAWQGVGEGMLESTKTEGTVTLTKSVLKGNDFSEYVIDME